MTYPKNYPVRRTHFCVEGFFLSCINWLAESAKFSVFKGPPQTSECPLEEKKIPIRAEMVIVEMGPYISAKVSIPIGISLRMSLDNFESQGTHF